MGAIILTAGKVRPDVRHPGSLLVDVTIALGDLPSVSGWAEVVLDADGEWVRSDVGESGAGWLAPPIARWLAAADARVRRAALKAIEAAAGAAVTPREEARACRILDVYLTASMDDHPDPAGLALDSEGVEVA